MNGTRTDTSRRKRDFCRQKSSPRGHRKAIARSLGVSLSELSFKQPTKDKGNKKGKNKGRSVLELADSAAAQAQERSEMGLSQP